LWEISLLFLLDKILKIHEKLSYAEVSFIFHELVKTTGLQPVSFSLKYA